MKIEIWSTPRATWKPTTWTKGGRNEDITCRRKNYDEPPYSGLHMCRLGVWDQEIVVTTTTSSVRKIASHEHTFSCGGVHEVRH